MTKCSICGRDLSLAQYLLRDTNNNTYCSKECFNERKPLDNGKG